MGTSKTQKLLYYCTSSPKSVSRGVRTTQHTCPRAACNCSKTTIQHQQRAAGARTADTAAVWRYNIQVKSYFYIILYWKHGGLHTLQQYTQRANLLSLAVRSLWEITKAIQSTLLLYLYMQEEWPNGTLKNHRKWGRHKSKLPKATTTTEGATNLGNGDLVDFFGFEIYSHRVTFPSSIAVAVTPHPEPASPERHIFVVIVAVGEDGLQP